MILFHVHASDRTAFRASRRPLSGWTVVPLHIDDAAQLGGDQLHHCLFDLDVTDLATALKVRGLMPRLEPGGIRLFAQKRGDHHGRIQAAALGATGLVDAPVTDAALSEALADSAASHPRPLSVVTGGLALDRAFRSTKDDRPLVVESLGGMAHDLSEDIGAIGIDAWLRSIRTHHAGTYQHCMTVTGLATAFGQTLGLSSPDLGKLTIGALLHDIGKALVDVKILDKAGPLTAAEWAVMQMHPVWGDDHLRVRSNVSAEIRAMVRGHHEYLDGSGYPDGLRGGQIDDLTRLLTIADVFGALVEERPYKRVMSAREALGVVKGMVEEGKLERALVRAFAPVAAQLRLPD